MLKNYAFLLQFITALPSRTQLEKIITNQQSCYRAELTDENTYVRFVEKTKRFNK